MVFMVGLGRSSHDQIDADLHCFRFVFTGDWPASLRFSGGSVLLASCLSLLISLLFVFPGDLVTVLPACPPAPDFKG